MADTAIEWATKVWNPTTGCDRVSAGCDNCYALTMAKRLKGMGSAKYQRDGDPRTSGPGFAATHHSGEVSLPMRWRKPQRIFVNSMSDLFHDDIPDMFISRVWDVIRRCPQHTFMVLTKRHARMRSLLSSDGFRETHHQLGGVGIGGPNGHLEHFRTWPLPNVWLGVSAENQQWADIRIPALLETPAAVRFVSAEPLLGPISIFANSKIDRKPGIDWLIVGGESGRGARPMYPGWVRHLRDECARAGTAFLFKQWGEWGPSLGRSRSQCLVWPDGTYREFDHTPGSFETGIPLTPAGWCNSERVGKKAAGRELDGRTWDQYPEAVPHA